MTKKNRNKDVLLVSMSLILSGCVVGPDYEKPPLDAPESWKNADLISSNIKMDQDWWSCFNDPVLSDLINRASQNNFDVKIALERVRESRSLWRGSKATLFPESRAKAGMQRNRNNIPGSPLTKPYTVFDAKLDASWELDIFGGRSREIEAADASIEASIEASNKIFVILFAEVAKTYIEIRNLQSQIHITKENIEIQKNTLALTQKQLDAGQTNKLDVLRADSQLWGTKSQLPYFESSLARLKYRLEYLLGEQPGALDCLLDKPKKVPVANLKLLTMAPSEVLNQRPDVRQAERELALATALQGVAIAQQYPKISILGLFGFQAADDRILFESVSKSWGGGVGIALPLLNFGKIQANIDAADARQKQAFLKYQQIILAALSDVESALVAYFKEEERRQSLARNVQVIREAVELAKKRYKEGFSSFLEVLDAERTLYISESQLAQSGADVSSNLIAVYKALGGGWQNFSS